MVAVAGIKPVDTLVSAIVSGVFASSLSGESSAGIVSSSLGLSPSAKRTSCSVLVFAAVDADGVFVSQQYLSRVFTEFMNCSVYEYLTNYRINKAKELLLINSRRKVQDIASDVGYSDASHFIVMFRKLTGMTPAQFRKLHI